MTRNKPTILIVENDAALNFTLRDTLENEGYRTMVTEDGEKALELIKETEPDLMILELMLPGVSGFEVCKKIRDQKYMFPIIILTARDQEIDKVTGLNFGADDYVTKPFGVKELIARINARLRRSETWEGGISDVLELGDRQLDLNAGVIRRPDGEEDLTTREVEILRYLAASPNEPVSRKTLLKHVWRYESSTSTRTVDVHISKLRLKIEPRPDDPKYLVTMHGVGYMLKLKQE